MIFRLGRNMAAMGSMAASSKKMAPTSVDELRALSRPQLLKLAGSLGVTLHATLTVRRHERDARGAGRRRRGRCGASADGRAALRRRRVVEISID